MGIETEGAKLALEVASVVGTALVSWVTIATKAVVNKIKLDQERNKAELVAQQTKVKEELVANQTDIKMDFAANNSALRMELAVHTTLDETRFGSIERAMVEQKESLSDQKDVLGTIEKKIDRNYSARKNGDDGG